MAGLWLVSYIVLWAIVLVMGLFLVGTLRHVGSLHLQLGASPSDLGTVMPDPPNDGPSIGSRTPDVVAETLNGFGTVMLPSQQHQGRILLMFMAPLCESCQRVVEALNALAHNAEWAVQPIVVMRADESTCRSFLSVFPLHLPVVVDYGGTIHKEFTVHRAPFGLLYGEDGTLTKKGVMHGQADLLELLDAVAAPASVKTHVFSHSEPSDALA